MKSSKPIRQFVLASLALGGCASAPQGVIPATMGELGAKHGTPIHGCLGETLDECRKELGMFGEIARVDPPSTERDLNGKLLPHSDEASISLGDISMDGTLFVFKLDASGKIVSAAADLPMLDGFLQFTQTEAEYDRSGIYPAAYMMLGNRCPSLSKLGIYKFFDSSIKPQLKHRTYDSSSSWGQAQQHHKSEVVTTYCGQYTKYTAEAGYDTDRISLENSTGVYQFNQLMFGKWE